MSRNYKFHNPEGLYFVSFAIIKWLDVFTRNEYKNIVLETLEFCMKNKGMRVYAWCIMTNHVHLVFSVDAPDRPELILGYFKRFTSRKLTEAISTNPQESRKDWLMQEFRAAGLATSNTTKYQFWQHDNHPIELWSNDVIKQKIDYIHNNPVEQGYVVYPKEYLYSSAIDYAGEQGLLKGVEVIDQVNIRF